MLIARSLACERPLPTVGVVGAGRSPHDHPAACARCPAGGGWRGEGRRCGSRRADVSVGDYARRRPASAFVAGCDVLTFDHSTSRRKTCAPRRRRRSSYPGPGRCATRRTSEPCVKRLSALGVPVPRCHRTRRVAAALRRQAVAGGYETGAAVWFVEPDDTCPTSSHRRRAGAT